MAQSTIRRALGAVKDQTSISLAKVGNSASLSDLDVAIVKATRHDDYPAEERHIREILSLTSFSRAFINSCVSTLSRRLSKTHSWTVALKTLILIHRLLAEGDPSYEQEIFFATRRGTRMLNLSDFRDNSRADSWDFSAFVRAYSRYLDERLEYRMHGWRQQRRRSRAASLSADEGEDPLAVATAVAVRATPVREMKTDRIFVKMQHLLQLLERFLACRPTGAARNNRIVAMALQPLIRESHQTYYEIQEIMNIFIDRFMEMEVADCLRVHAIFTRLAKQLQDLSSFYNWCKSSSVSRTYDFPFINRIPPTKLQLMDDLIRHRSNLIQNHHVKDPDQSLDINYDTNIPALPAPPELQSDQEYKEDEEEEIAVVIIQEEQEEERQQEAVVDLLDLSDYGATKSSTEEHEDQLALALFDMRMEMEEFKLEEGGDDWETALVQSVGVLSNGKPALGGGFDMLLLDGLYSQSDQMMRRRLVGDGSASSVAMPAMPAMLALPAPPGALGVDRDPFVASLAVPPPAYVQMSEMEKKQQLMGEEQRLWQQYAKEGMQGKLGFVNFQSNYNPSQQQHTGGF